ncbi:MAG: tetratricopeptide repeat protein [Spirochaetales bacterium]|nr:tetratricopeptide repeat protein [Spirochaetales bacterium]
MKNMTVEEIFIRVKSAMKMGAYDLAETLLEKLIKEKPQYYLPYVLLGNVCLRTGRPDEAIEQFGKAVRLKTDNPDVYNNMGIALKESSRYAEALSNLDRALRLAKDRADILYNIGNVYRETGEYDKAVEFFKKAIERDQSFVLTYNNMGTILERQGKYDEALDIYLKGLRYDVNNPLLNYNIGIILENRGAYEKAKSHFELALKSRPGWTDALNNLGVVLGKMGRHEDSCAVFKEVLRIQPENVKAINNLGIEYGKLEEIEKATACYRKARDINPEYHRASMNLGILLANQGYYDEALDEMEKLLLINPDDHDARFRMATILFSLKRYRAAEREFLHILKKKPDHPETLRALGNLYLRSDREEEAKEYYAKLEKIDPERKAFHFDMAVVLNERNEIEKSQEETKKYLKRHPEDTDARSLLGELYYKQGDLKQASELLAGIVTEKPRSVEPYYYLAKTYRNMGDPEKAIEVVGELITIQGKRGSVIDLSNLSETLALYEEATNEYEKKFIKGLYNDSAHLRDFGLDESDSDSSIDESDSVYSPLDAAKLLKSGTGEDFIPVKEEEERITIVDGTDIEDTYVEIRDEEPPPYTDLLKNEELYENIEKIKSRQEKQEEILKSLKHTEIRKESPPGFNEEKDDVKPEKEKNREKKTEIKPLAVLPAKDHVLPIGDGREETFRKLSESIENLTETLKSSKSRFIPIPVFSPGSQNSFDNMGRPGPHAFRVRGKKRRKKKKEKPKSLRDELRGYIQKVRSKLDEENTILLPEDEKKRQDIKKLVDALTHRPDFPERTDGTEEAVKDIDDVDKAGIDTGDRDDMVPNNEKSETEKKETDEDDGAAETEENRLSPVSVETTPDEFLNTDLDEKITVGEEEEIVIEETKDADQYYPPSAGDKSFKPRIRATKTPFARSMIIGMLRFFRKLIVLLPFPGFKKNLDEKINDTMNRIRK